MSKEREIEKKKKSDIIWIGIGELVIWIVNLRFLYRKHIEKKKTKLNI
jgi:hypothetical protein